MESFTQKCLKKNEVDPGWSSAGPDGDGSLSSWPRHPLPGSQEEDGERRLFLHLSEVPRPDGRPAL